MYNEQTETYAHMLSHTHTHTQACAWTHMCSAKSTPTPALLCTRQTKHIVIGLFEPPKTLLPSIHTRDKEQTKTHYTPHAPPPPNPRSLRLCPPPICSAPPPNSHKREQTHTKAVHSTPNSSCYLNKRRPLVSVTGFLSLSPRRKERLSCSHMNGVF